jgi:hypothetical protein
MKGELKTMELISRMEPIFAMEYTLRIHFEPNSAIISIFGILNLRLTILILQFSN